MNRVTVSILVLALVSILTASSFAQRGVGAESIVVDDGNSHTITVVDPSGLTSNYTWTIPINPTTGASSAFVPAGTTNNSTLRWDAGSSSWMENISIKADNSGNISGGTGASIGFPSSGLTAGEIILTPTAQNVVVNGTVSSVGGDFSIGTNPVIDFNRNSFFNNSTVQGYAVISSTESDAATAGNTVTISGNHSLATVTVGAATANITASVTTGNAAGEILYIWNNNGSGYTVTLGGYAIPDGSAAQYLYLGGAWIHVH